MAGSPTLVFSSDWCLVCEYFLTSIKTRSLRLKVWFSGNKPSKKSLGSNKCFRDPFLHCNSYLFPECFDPSALPNRVKQRSSGFCTFYAPVWFWNIHLDQQVSQTSALTIFTKLRPAFLDLVWELEQAALQSSEIWACRFSFQACSFYCDLSDEQHVSRSYHSDMKPLLKRHFSKDELWGLASAFLWLIFTKLEILKEMLSIQIEFGPQFLRGHYDVWVCSEKVFGVSSPLVCPCLIATSALAGRKHRLPHIRLDDDRGCSSFR